MESEQQFFMTEKDQNVFFDFVLGLVDSIDLREESQTYQFSIDDCSLIFTPSPQDKNILYAGKLNIKTECCKKEERTKKVYRKLKSWLKKNYWSRLAYLNQNKNNQLTPSRAYWVGPDAKSWKDEDPEDHVFKLSATSWMVFDIGI
jgi:hypothetical protein